MMVCKSCTDCRGPIVKMVLSLNLLNVSMSAGVRAQYVGAGDDDDGS